MSLLGSAWLLASGVVRRTWFWATGVILTAIDVYERFLQDQLPPAYRLDVPDLMADWIPFGLLGLVVLGVIAEYHQLRMKKETQAEEQNTDPALRLQIEQLKLNLPRELTAEQKLRLERELKKNMQHKNCAIAIYTTDAVRDGAGYAADFEAAFKGAGWYAFRASDPQQERDYESGLLLRGGGTGQPVTVDLLDGILSDIGVKHTLVKEKAQTIDLVIGRERSI